MNTAILTVVLAGSLLAGQNAATSWQNDYSTAQRQGIAQKRPLLVVFGSGPNGWSTVIGEATPTSEFGRLLADRYVCLYVDTTSPTGKKLAQNFGIAQSRGFVISDHTGESQAFWHQGDMEISQVTSYLRKYSVPSMAARTTDTASTSRSSYYEAAPSSFQGFSRSLPSANC